LTRRIDTVFLITVFGISGGATADFYIAFFLTLILSCICNDSRGLLVITFLSPLLYGYIVLNANSTFDPSVYLRLPFPLVVSMFYGYFAQVERIRRVAREHEREAGRHREAAEQIRRQRERLEILHELNLAVTSSIDAAKILDIFLEKSLIHLPYAAVVIRLRNHETGIMETAASRSLGAKALNVPADAYAVVDRVAERQAPLAVRNALADSGIEHVEFLSEEGLVSFLGLPLIANGEVLGSLAFWTQEEHDFSADELEFLSTLAGQVAIAVNHAQLFEQIRRQASELQHASKVKDEFLGVVSHELRTPLNVISGYTNMLLGAMLGEITPIQEKALQTVARQSRELHNLINCILQVSSIEADVLKAEFHEVNVWEFLSELRSSYDYPLPKEIRMVWEFPADLPTVKADRGKLKHILENLINNAIKFTDQGTVTVSARYLAHKRLLEIKVSDTGIGIPKDRVATIFERFRQVDSSDTRAYSGVGLGLYIVKKLTDLLEGTIHVDSKPGHGSIFTVRVPCQAQKPPPARLQLSFLAEIQTTSG
jgi:signal transduction histidine kinase